MKALIVILFAILFASCKESPTQSTQPDPKKSTIVAHVFSEGQGIAGVSVVLKPPNDTLRTDSLGDARFSVAPGEYIVQALRLMGPGPALRSPSDTVTARAGETVKVEFFDCLACLSNSRP
jgi:hypothetical protein